jgi:hypothetical protein
LLVTQSNERAKTARHDMEREIAGSMSYIHRRLLPLGKEVNLMLWPENAPPSPEAPSEPADGAKAAAAASDAPPVPFEDVLAQPAKKKGKKKKEKKGDKKEEL